MFIKKLPAFPLFASTATIIFVQSIHRRSALIDVDHRMIFHILFIFDWRLSVFLVDKPPLIPHDGRIDLSFLKGLHEGKSMLHFFRSQFDDRFTLGSSSLGLPRVPFPAYQGCYSMCSCLNKSGSLLDFSIGCRCMTAIMGTTATSAYMKRGQSHPHTFKKYAMETVCLAGLDPFCNNSRHFCDYHSRQQ
jgi:hypothetical protein